MAQVQQTNDINSKVVVIEVNNYSFVNLDQIKYLENSIIKINRAKPTALVVKINCSGGLASELREFIELYKNLKIPKIAYVTGEAAGPGAVVALSSDYIYLSSENSIIGGETKPI